MQLQDILTTLYVSGNKKHLKHLKVRLKHLCFSFSNQSILSNYKLNSQTVNYRQFSQSDNWWVRAHLALVWMWEYWFCRTVSLCECDGRRSQMIRDRRPAKTTKTITAVMLQQINNALCSLSVWASLDIFFFSWTVISGNPLLFMQLKVTHAADMRESLGLCMISSFMCIGRSRHVSTTVEPLLGLCHAYITRTHTHLRSCNLCSWQQHSAAHKWLCA